jgi:adenylosuccinate synthase
MKKAKVVIGANFGDEGKGLITDYYAAPHGAEALVVRYNGGAQAGHTVVTPEGKRHVFSHFGSGSFAGAHTFLSHFFVCNPILFLKEYNLLRGKTAVPPVHVDGRAPVTTPYDMMINQIAEEARGHGRHGSCGMGFGETIERNSSNSFVVVYADLMDKAALKKKLAHIRDNWVSQRLAALGITSLTDKWKERLASAAVPENFLADIDLFLQATQLAGQGFLAGTRKHIVFEGAQGLLLDQERGWFPHVTRSHTGIKNVLVLSHEAGLSALDVTYITRAYATRHGAGPLPHELPHLPYPRIRDETNVANDWQGTLRFGWLDADLLATSIARDLSDNKSGIRLRPGLAVTCLDQLEPRATVIKGGGQTATDDEALAALLKKAVNAEFLLVSRGPSRKAVSGVA